MMHEHKLIYISSVGAIIHTYRSFTSNKFLFETVQIFESINALSLAVYEERSILHLISHLFHVLVQSNVCLICVLDENKWDEISSHKHALKICITIRIVPFLRRKRDWRLLVAGPLKVFSPISRAYETEVHHLRPRHLNSCLNPVCTFKAFQ